MCAALERDRQVHDNSRQLALEGSHWGGANPNLASKLLRCRHGFGYRRWINHEKNHYLLTTRRTIDSTSK
jgi:hypothetical protein